MRFERAPGTRKPGTDDGTGRVNIQIRLVTRGQKMVHGNINRSVTLANAKVSDVFAAIEQALFDPPGGESQ